MTQIPTVLVVLVAVESAIYHGIGIYRHYHWFRKKKLWQK